MAIETPYGRPALTSGNPAETQRRSRSESSETTGQWLFPPVQHPPQSLNGQLMLSSGALHRSGWDIGWAQIVGMRHRLSEDSMGLAWVGADVQPDTRSPVEQDAIALSTEIILRELCLIEEAPWGDLRGKQLDARGLATRLRPYGIHRSTFRSGSMTCKGYQRTDLHDAWLRYLPPPPYASVTAVTAETDGRSVPHVTDVTAPMGGRGIDWDEAPF